MAIHFARGMSLELQREIHKLTGINPNKLTRVVIDIKADDVPMVYVIGQPLTEDLPRLVEVLRLEVPEVQTVDKDSRCTNDVQCPVETEHMHTFNHPQKLG